MEMLYQRKGRIRRRSSSAALILGILPIFLPQCTPDDSQDTSEASTERDAPERRPTEVRHPIEGALLSNSTDAPVHDLELSDLESETPTGLAAITEFPEEAAVGFVGMLEDDTAQVLGEIIDAIMLPSEHPAELALLDKSYGMVRTFAPDGTPQATFGGIGEGPGELRSPVALGYADGAFLILDAALKIERYGWTGAEWEPAGRLQLPMDAQDLCPLDEGLAVVGMRIGEDGRLGSSQDPRAVHILSGPGQEVSTSFSAPYSYDGILALWYMMRGKLTCDSGRGVVWVAYEALGEVHALDVDGSLLWIARLTDMAVPQMVEMEGRSIGGDRKPGEPVEIITHISLLDESLLAVQVWSVSIELNETGRPGERTSSYRTYFIDAHSGLGVGGFRGDHQVIGGGNGQAILYREDPFPQFAVVAIGGG